MHACTNSRSRMHTITNTAHSLGLTAGMTHVQGGSLLPPIPHARAHTHTHTHTYTHTHSVAHARMHQLTFTHAHNHQYSSLPWPDSWHNARPWRLTAATPSQPLYGRGRRQQWSAVYRLSVCLATCQCQGNQNDNGMP